MNLKELRKAKGLSQEQAAKALNITLRAYQNYEYGQREPNIEMINKLADFYGVTTDYLLGREAEPNPLAMLNVKVDDDKFVEIYKDLPDYAKQIFIDTMIKLAESAKDN